MDYSTASSIRGTKLTSLIADRIMSGGSVGSSIKGALSDRMKAKAMGVKERYDPLNIAKKLTGGGSLAPALLGRMMGRSKEDIQYFAGKGTATALGHETGNIGGGSVDVLNRILSFLQKSHEVDVRTMEVKKNFQEEAMNEDERRHQEFLEALKAFTSGNGTATTIINNYGNGEDGGSSIFDVLDNIGRPGSGGGKGRGGKGRLSKLMEKSGRGLRSAGRLTGVYGAFLAPFMFAAEEKEKIDADPYNPAWKDNPYAMEVQSRLEGGTKTQGQAGQENMRAAMRRMVDQSAKNMETPSSTSGMQALPAGNSTAGAGRGSAEFARTDPRLIGGSSTGSTPMTSMSPSSGGSTSSPITPMPSASGVAEATNANIDLNLEQTAPSGGGTTPIVTNTTNNMGNQKTPASTTASQRDSTDILLYIYGALNKAGFI